MKMIYVIIGLLIVAGSFLLFNKMVWKNHSDKPQSPETGQVKRTKVQVNKYNEIRSMAFTVTPDKLKLTLRKDKTLVYGTIMDLDLDGVTATVVSFQTGDASLYLSSGQMFIGGFAHETVRKSATDLVSNSQAYLTKAEKTSSTALSDKGCVKFYFLTNHGTFVHQETIANITKPENDWNKLFDKGQNVISEYRLITGDRLREE